MPDATQTRVAASGKVSVAPLGTALPVTAVAALAAQYTDLGYTTDDGVTFSADATVEDINAWQAAAPVRRITTARSITASFSLLQWNKETFALAFGGGTWSEPSTGVFRYDPPADTAALAEYVMVIDWVDGAKSDRLILKRGNVSDAVETNLVRSGAALLPVTFTALTPDGSTTSWAFLSNDTTFDIP